MIFCGDVAIADGDLFEFKNFPCEFYESPLCINFEGAIKAEGALGPDWGTYNTEQWISSFDGFKLAPVFLANNHICDIPGGIKHTQNHLVEKSLESFGAGGSKTEASAPCLLETSTGTTGLLGFGWHVIGCQVTRGGPGVNALWGEHVRMQVERLKVSVDRLVVIIHGNYEFEKYPQPGHRKLALQLIDMGVSAVIFHHPHIVGPIERYKGKTIAYSLGNWAFSYGKFFGGKLKFPSTSFHQIAVELRDDGDMVHHAQFSPPNLVTYQVSERVDSEKLSLKADFEGMSDSEYLAWFKKNRLKRKGLPIYTDADSSLVNHIKDSWVRLRQMMVDSATKLGLKKMRRP